MKRMQALLVSYEEQKSDLKQHVNSVHDKLKPFNCSICSQQFSQKGHLNVHVKKVHEKLKQGCPHCDKSFHQNYLKAHILAVHEKTSFKCTFCKESYSEKKELRAHVKNVHMPTKENN